MVINVDNYSINYITAGDMSDTSRPPIILLHGWGVDHTSFLPVIEFLGETHRVYAPDFPGFGGSPEPECPIDIFQYAELTQKFIEKLDIQKPVLMGHSFGGRVSIILGSRIELTGIMLIDSAGIVPTRGIDYHVKVWSYKLMKNFCSLPLIRNIYGDFLNAYRGNAGSDDYKKASQTMKRILSTIVNQDLKSYMPSIKYPTLLFWGELDDATPLSDAKIMESLIPDAALVVVKGGGHYSYLDNFPLFKSVSLSFLDSLQDSLKGSEVK